MKTKKFVTRGRGGSGGFGKEPQNLVNMTLVFFFFTFLVKNGEMKR